MRRTTLELFLVTTAVGAVVGLSLPVHAAEEAAAPVPAAAATAEPGKTTAPTTAPAAAVAAAPAAAPDAASEAGSAADAQPAAPAPAAPTAAAPEAAEPAAADPAAVVPAQIKPPVAAPVQAPVVQAPAQTPDQRIADKIHDLFGGHSERILDRRTVKAVEAFYTARNFAPLWIDNGIENDRAKAAAAYLSGVAADGLDPADYPVPAFSGSGDPATLAEADLKFTAAVLAYARHAQLGRVHYSRVSPDIAYNQVAPEPGEVLRKLTETTDQAAALDSFNPPHAGYRALKAKLAEVRGRSGGGGAGRIEAGPTLKPGMDDPRVTLLRERLGVAGADGTVYDKALSDRVKDFQHEHDLPANGLLTPATVAAINGPRHDRDADIIIANMDRWRWLPRDLGDAYVMVNIPDYTLRVVKDDALVWTTKIVAGQPGEKATPLLSETMKYITVNPTWNVPPSIINNEYLPALERDPTVLDRMGLKVEYNRDGTVHIYQPPGDGNALGRIRFNFPNKFLVYQHDTPDKRLFMQSRRAFSHGCMRVQFPDKYAEVLLGIANPKDGYTADKIHQMYGTGERDIHLTTPIPVHLTYQTAFVDDAGRLVIRDDVYGRDVRHIAALKGDERRVADVAVAERRDPNSSSQPRRQASRVPASSPFNLFGGLFR